MGESRLQRDILLALGSLPGVIVYRNSVGVAEHTRDDGKIIRMAYGLGPGTPDLMFFAGPFVLGLEVKTDDGRQSEAQRQVQAQWALNGTPYQVVRSVEDARAALARVRRELDEYRAWRRSREAA